MSYQRYISVEPIRKIVDNQLDDWQGIKIYESKYGRFLIKYGCAEMEIHIPQETNADKREDSMHDLSKKRVAIVQSNYIPWKGYFDIISAVDEFIIYDDMQFTKRDWRNRNKIKTPHGVQWLTIPVKSKGNFNQKICETKIAGTDWSRDHWQALTLNYKRAPYFNEIAAWLEPVFMDQKSEFLSDVNRRFIEIICSFLGIKTKITNSWAYPQVAGRSRRLLGLCEAVCATEYFSGPSAKAYLDETIFAEKGIKVTWFDYAGYPAYPQQWGDFVHEVTILDLLFNTGSNARNYMKNTWK